MRHHTPFQFASSTFPIGLLAFLVLVPLARPCFAQEPEKDGVGLIVSSQTASKDVGLPIYPGSKPPTGDTNDSQSARLGLWGSGSGFKLAVLKMESADSPEKLVAFYKKALAHYGKVIDCSNASPSSADADKKDSSMTLSCGDDRPNQGGMLFKSGSKEKQHIVAIQPNGKGSRYQLVALGSWGTDSRH